VDPPLFVPLWQVKNYTIVGVGVLVALIVDTDNGFRELTINRARGAVEFITSFMLFFRGLLRQSDVIKRRRRRHFFS
jgi:hypothetical protein